MRVFYLSFAKDDQFLGAVFVEITDGDIEHAKRIIAEEWPDIATRGDEAKEAARVGAAICRTWLLGINPGGESLVLEVPLERIEKIPNDMYDRLLSKQELIERGFGRTVPYEDIQLRTLR